MQSIKIRLATLDDAPQLLQIYAYYVQHTAITFEYDIPAITEFEQRILTTLQRYPYLVAENMDGNIWGYAYAGVFKARAAYDWAVESSIYLAHQYQQQGLGKRLYQALEYILQQQNILNINACIAYTEQADEYLNQGSIYFHEKMGYRRVGQFQQCGYKFTRWYDMVWMEKHIGVHISPPKPVMTISELLYRQPDLFAVLNAELFDGRNI